MIRSGNHGVVAHASHSLAVKLHWALRVGLAFLGSLKPPNPRHSQHP